MRGLRLYRSCDLDIQRNVPQCALPLKDSLMWRRSLDFPCRPTPQRRRQQQCTFVCRKTPASNSGSLTTDPRLHGHGKGGDSRSSPNMTHPSSIIVLALCRGVWLCRTSALLWKSRIIQASGGDVHMCCSQSTGLIPCTPPPPGSPTAATSVTQSTHSCNQDKTVRLP